MRLFIAINLPKEVKDYLWELKEEFRELGKFNLTAKSKYHITLKFLGEIKEDLSEIKFSSFETSLNKLGCFNDRILWINLIPEEGVLKLAKLIDQEFMEKEQRFSAHITLARIKSIKNKNKFIEKLETKVKPIKFKISSFELMKSILSKDGAKYETLETYSLNQ